MLLKQFCEKTFPKLIVMTQLCGVGIIDTRARVRVADCPAMSFVFVC